MVDSSRVQREGYDVKCQSNDAIQYDSIDDWITTITITLLTQ